MLAHSSHFNGATYCTQWTIMKCGSRHDVGDDVHMCLLVVIQHEKRCRIA